ncbi:hypothetical protein PIB30_054048 [Stylosanthes scabra]|uniref:Disease resistance RPP13-like protein 1 n=1 Tax=Stylosanthes scabra TaxID=79078 RepID=A0ABU6TJK4_9FABA|nr:hypothetical protein [Stylosanthes scabra]
MDRIGTLKGFPFLGPGGDQRLGEKGRNVKKGASPRAGGRTAQSIAQDRLFFLLPWGRPVNKVVLPWHDQSRRLSRLKQLENHEVKDWLNSLRDAIYTADDLLDRVCTKVATQKGVRTFWPSFLNSEDRQMVNEIERVVRRIEDLEKRKGYLGLQKISTSSFSWKTPSTSLVRGNVYGREDDGKALVKMLNVTNEHQLSVISIVGMGGVGKTTLAQWMYNNAELMKGFNLKAWCCISENFNIVETTKDIVKEIPNASFPESNGNPTLEGIGKKIARKCDGLPLAAETLGCLCRRHDVEEWEKILRSDIWGFSINDSKIIPALLVSYYQLPSYLKRCFVYCSLFPKDYQFGKDELILLWMAEDLLRPPNRGESLEEVGCKCFEELTSRLFFKPCGCSFERFVMHDLLHDLAIFFAGDFYCRIEELCEEQEEKKVLTRHLSYFEHGSLGHPISEVFNSIAKMESLRTLFFEDLLSMESIVSKFKYLRVLSFSKHDVLPDSIGELIHLRYLNLSWSHINRLPESLCNLYNLRTLILYRCTKLTMLPTGMHNLVNLQHLDLRRTSLKEMPGGISKLNHLLTLCYFVVGKNEDNGIQELGGLLNLHGSLHLNKLENIADVKKAENARMITKNLIDKLYLEWSSGDDLVLDTQTERDILDSLLPHSGLKELEIKGYKGTSFPNWVGHSSYNQMTSVSLEFCNNCFILPSLGLLPSLKKLRIQGFGKLMSVGMEFYRNEGDRH